MQVELAQTWSKTVASSFGDSFSSAGQNSASSASAKGEDARVESSTTMPQFRFEDLAQGNSRILIQFGDAVYELKSTRNGRLVLNK